MIVIKDNNACDKMRAAGALLSQLFGELGACIEPGISTLKLDSIIEKKLHKRGLISQSKGYMGYRHVSCISLNDEVVHGVPHENRIISNGDLVKVDVCAAYKGYCADMARCFTVGNVEGSVTELVSAAQRALNEGIGKAVAGGRLGDICQAIQRTVEGYGFGVVRDFAGHGIGACMHEDPEILNYGRAGDGPELKAGMAFALEPMITMGKYHVYVMDDGWTARTVDGSLAAHIEDTVIITDHGPEVVTRMA